jgi:integrase
MKIGKFKDNGTGRWKWTADFTCARVRHRLVADSTKELYDQVDAIKKKARDIKLGLPVERRSITLKEMVEEYVRDFDKSDKNRKRARTVLEGFASRHPGKTVEGVTAADLRDYVRARKQEFLLKQRFAEQKRRAKKGAEYVPRDPMELSPHAVNKELSFISAMLNSAAEIFEEDLRDYRPPRVPWASIPRGWRRRPIRRDEDEALLGWLRAPRRAAERDIEYNARLEVADHYEITINTGMRPGECTSLTWPQVDFEAMEIYLGRTKNGEDRFVPVNSRVAEILRRRRESATSKFVFPNPKGTRPRCDYYRTYRRAARELGLAYGQRVENGWTPYSTRHTAVTRMLRAGADISSVQEVVGHSNATMSLHYSHATRASTRRAAESLVRHGDDKKSPAEEEAVTEAVSAEHMEEV